MHDNTARILEAVGFCPIIAAVKDDAGLQKCLKTDCKVVFILYGTICSVAAIVEKVKQADKFALVHMDLITGLSPKDIAVDFIQMYTKADGIISTKPFLVKRAKELGLFTVQRFFVLDSIALSNIQKQIETSHPDLIEMMPAPMPKVIKRICGASAIPVVAGGLVADKEDVYSALNAGAVAISTTKEAIWSL